MTSVEKLEDIEPTPKIYPIGGGKGGVGKSFVAASLGTLIAGHGKTVALVDLDLGASNLHTFLGMPASKDGLNLFLNKTAKKLEGVAVPTPVTNLFLVSSSNCSMEIANLFYAQKIKLINAIKKLPFEFLGGVAFDERVIDSIYERKLYVQNYPGTITTMELKQIAELITNNQPAPSLV